MSNIISSIEHKSTLEIHYYFKDQSHSIDAGILISNLNDVLEMIKIISNTFHIKNKVVIEPPKEGGFEAYITIIEEASKNYPFIAGSLATSVGFILSNSTKPLFENVFKSKATKESEKLDLKLKELELKQKTLEVEQKRKEIEILHNKSKEVEQKSISLEENPKIIHSKSKFYREINKIDKISKIGFNTLVNNELIQDEAIVKKELFNNYILDLPIIEPKIIENAVITIVSPVLEKDKNIKWNGLFNEIDININMKSNIFKSEIQSKRIQFETGSKINCRLEMIRKSDAIGNIKVTAYNVLNVWSYSSRENVIQIEIPEDSNKLLIAN